MTGLPAALSPLAARDQFITWIAVPHATKAGKCTKLPCAPASGAVVDAHNPAHWTNAETALAVARPAPDGGVGFVFTADDPWFFLDIDNCLLPEGTWSALAQELCALFAGAAVEVSHSGKGLHIFGRYSGELPPHGTKNTALGLEFYTSGRFVALTGYGATGDADHDCTAILAANLATYFPPGAAATREPGDWTTEPVAEWSGPLDDEDLVRLAIKAGSKPSVAEVFGGAARASFGVLWHAEADSLARVWPGNSPGGYDASNADMSLANHLAFWTGKDCERMERLMRQSALVREKWDSPSHRGYLATTILKACAYVTGVATGRKDQVVAAPGDRRQADRPDFLVNFADRPATAANLRAVLANAPDCFDRGGVPVLLKPSALGELPSAKRMTHNNVIDVGYRYCRPVKLKEDGSYTPTSLPDNVAKMYLDLGDFGLRPLAGISSAPLLGEDGRMRTATGYDPDLALWCEPVSDLAVPDCPTAAEAAAALFLIRNQFRTFPFKGSPTLFEEGVFMVDIDRAPSLSESAFLCGLLTAVCRPSLHLAPGLLVVAPEVTGAGAGKGLLVRAICAIAFGHQPPAFTAGHDRQELDKRITAALIEASQVLFLDNSNSTALRSDTLASLLTERPAHVRIMGKSEMVPLNSAAFVALTGNGLSVSEDLGRRFLTVDLAPQCDDPEARPFRPGFLRGVNSRRAELLSAALTIWRWGRQNPLPSGLTLGSYEIWSRWVRDPLLALGCADPVERIREAKAADPNRQFIADLFSVWLSKHGVGPITAADLDPAVLAILNPQGRSRQYVAQRVAQMDGTRGAGHVMTKQKPAGKWAAATYAIIPAT